MTTIDESQVVQDPLDDEAGRLIREVLGERSLTRRRELRDKLVRQLKASGYIDFIGNPLNYHLRTTGQSYLYRVPETKKGNLQKLRGKLIRIVCVGSTRMDPDLMAGVYRPAGHGN
ncbi:MAG: hypothetical protein WCL32_23975 [Planctomycetota bacterium]